MEEDEKNWAVNLYSCGPNFRILLRHISQVGSALHMLYCYFTDLTVQENQLETQSLLWARNPDECLFRFEATP